MRPAITLFIVTICVTVALGTRAVDDPIVLMPTNDVTIYSSAGEQWAGEGARPTMDLMGNKPEDKHRILISFDFKNEAETPCTAAILRLHADEIWPNKNKAYIRIQRLVRPFSEVGASWVHATATDSWINGGGDFDPIAICARKLGRESGKNQTLEFDLTPLVRLWQTKQCKNCGMLLTLEDGSDTYVRFHSKEAGESERPKLMLYYNATAPKIGDMIKPDPLPPLGKMPEFKLEVLSSKNFETVADKEWKLGLVVRGGLPPYVWKYATLPAGLTGTPQGLISGAPKPGKFTFNATVSDADNRTATVPLTLTVTENKEVKPADPGKAVAAKTKSKDED